MFFADIVEKDSIDILGDEIGDTSALLALAGKIDYTVVTVHKYVNYILVVNFLKNVNFIFDIFPSSFAFSKPFWLVNLDGYFDSRVTNALAEVDY